MVHMQLNGTTRTQDIEIRDCRIYTEKDGVAKQWSDHDWRNNFLAPRFVATPEQPLTDLQKTQNLFLRDPDGVHVNQGIALLGARNVVIDGCEIFNVYSGIRMTSVCYGVTINNCEISRMYNDGVTIQDSAKIRITNNAIHGFIGKHFNPQTPGEFAPEYPDLTVPTPMVHSDGIQFQGSGAEEYLLSEIEVTGNEIEGRQTPFGPASTADPCIQGIIQAGAPRIHKAILANNTVRTDSVNGIHLVNAQHFGIYYNTVVRLTGTAYPQIHRPQISVMNDPDGTIVTGNNYSRYGFLLNNIAGRVALIGVPVQSFPYFCYAKNVTSTYSVPGQPGSNLGDPDLRQTDLQKIVDSLGTSPSLELVAGANPARNAGVASLPPHPSIPEPFYGMPSVDIDGIARGSSPNIGAFED
jgi:hypothetical protein